MKKIGICLLALFVFVSCDKNEGNEANKGNEGAKLRVVKITGSNEMWGDNYTLNISYNSINQINEAYAINNQGDTLTYIEGRKDNTEMKYSVNDYERDPETGKLIRDTQKRYSVKNKMRGELIISQIIEEFAPKAVIEPTDYEPEKYIKLTYAKYVYEYDEQQKIINSRKMLKVFNTDPDDAYYQNDEFETFISKDRIIYEGNRVLVIENYVSDSKVEDSNYRLNGKEVMNYSGDKLQSIDSDNDIGSKTFVYSGNDVKVGDVVYTLNADGFVTKIVVANGSVMTIEYEAGAGNFETLLPLLNKAYSIPAIR